MIVRTAQILLKCSLSWTGLKWKTTLCFSAFYKSDIRRISNSVNVWLLNRRLSCFISSFTHSFLSRKRCFERALWKRLSRHCPTCPSWRAVTTPYPSFLAHLTSETGDRWWTHQSCLQLGKSNAGSYQKYPLNIIPWSIWKFNSWLLIGTTSKVCTWTFPMWTVSTKDTDLLQKHTEDPTYLMIRNSEWDNSNTFANVCSYRQDERDIHTLRAAKSFSKLCSGFMLFTTS